MGDLVEGILAAILIVAGFVSIRRYSKRIRQAEVIPWVAKWDERNAERLEERSRREIYRRMKRIRRAAARRGALSVENSTGVAAKGLSWAGFRQIDDLELLDLFEELGRDTTVLFVLRGQPDDIDGALTSAELTLEMKSGVSDGHALLQAFDLGSVSGVKSGEDRWTNASGEVVNRLAVRGTTEVGLDALHVSAFTTRRRRARTLAPDGA